MADVTQRLIFVWEKSKAFARLSTIWTSNIDRFYGSENQVVYEILSSRYFSIVLKCGH